MYEIVPTILDALIYAFKTYFSIFQQKNWYVDVKFLHIEF